jgi:hypothetical protein
MFENSPNLVTPVKDFFCSTWRLHDQVEHAADIKLMRPLEQGDQIGRIFALHIGQWFTLIIF